MFIFILQGFWLHIKELAGKGLGINIVFRFLVLIMPRLVILVLPLTILLTSIMVFGKFAENYEFAAMKSTGISLQRAMASLSVFILGLSFVTFFFANDVIPAAEAEFYSLRRNIARVNPSAAITEGQFTQLGDDTNIKVVEKSGEKGEFLKTVTIHKKDKSTDRTNKQIIVSKTGEFISDKSSDIIKLVLYDGFMYVEKENQAFIKTPFKTYDFNIDLKELNDVDFDKKTEVQNHSMLGINGLKSQIDTIKSKRITQYNGLSKNMLDRSKINVFGKGIKPSKKQVFGSANVLDVLDTPKQKLQALNIAVNSTKTAIQIFNSKEKSITNQSRNLNKHVIAYHEKFAFAIMCIVLFFVGAPLGALIKKGGIGLPIIIAVLLFLIYHFIGLFSKNGAKDGSMDPVFATWLSTFVMLPLGIYFTSRATKDRSIVDFHEMLLPLLKLVSPVIPSYINSKDTTVLPVESETYQIFKKYSDEKLIAIVKNFHRYDTSKISHRNTALEILKKRGHTKRELNQAGNLANENYINALQFFSMSKGYSVLALVFYVFSFGIISIGIILKDKGFNVLGISTIIIGVLSFLIYIISVFKMQSFKQNYLKLLNKNETIDVVLFYAIGLPFYIIYAIFFNKKMNTDDLTKIE